MARTRTHTKKRPKTQVKDGDLLRYNISLFENIFVVSESGLKFLPGDRALLPRSPAIPCQFPRQMAIDGPEWGKCLVNKASRRYSAGFRELNSVPHTPCPIFYFQSFFYIVSLLLFTFKERSLLAFTGKVMFFFKLH
jgi:hypothetical protein